MAENDPIETLRAAGHTEAAELLALDRKRQQEAEIARKGPGETKPAGITLINDRQLGLDDQMRREGESLLEGMRAAGILQDHGNIGLFGGQR